MISCKIWCSDQQSCSVDWDTRFQRPHLPLTLASSPYLGSLSFTDDLCVQCELLVQEVCVVCVVSQYQLTAARKEILIAWHERLSAVGISLSPSLPSSPALLFQPESPARPCPAFLPLLLWTAWLRKNDCCSVRVFLSSEALDMHPHGWRLQLKIRCSLYPIKKRCSPTH